MLCGLSTWEDSPGCAVGSVRSPTQIDILRGVSPIPYTIIFLVAEVITDKEKKSTCTGCHKQNRTEVTETQPTAYCILLFKISSYKTTVISPRPPETWRKATLKSRGFDTTCILLHYFSYYYKMTCPTTYNLLPGFSGTYMYEPDNTAKQGSDAVDGRLLRPELSVSKESAQWHR